MPGGCRIEVDRRSCKGCAFAESLAVWGEVLHRNVADGFDRVAGTGGAEGVQEGGELGLCLGLAEDLMVVERLSD